MQRQQRGDPTTENRTILLSATAVIEKTLSGLLVEKVYSQPNVNIELAISQVVSATNSIRALSGASQAIGYDYLQHIFVYGSA
jgi:hypothetical protein